MFNKMKRLFGGIPPEVTVEEKGIGKIVIKADKENPSISLPYPDFSHIQNVPRSPITLVSPACPQCGVIQDPPPTRKKKCRDCKETIYTWTDQETRKKELLTYTQHAKREREAWDARWQACNAQVIEGSRLGNWHTVKMAHFQQALMLFKRGRDHQMLAAESRKSELRHYGSLLKDAHVTISTTGDAACSTCKPHEGKKYSTEEALKLMPIPHTSCLTWANQNPHGGWCRCSYIPIIQ